MLPQGWSHRYKNDMVVMTKCLANRKFPFFKDQYIFSLLSRNVSFLFHRRDLCRTWLHDGCPVKSWNSLHFVSSLLFFLYFFLCWGPCCVCFVFYPMLSVSLDCPFLIAHSVFSNVYLSIIQHTLWLALCRCQFIIKDTLERVNCNDQLPPRLYDESGDYRFPICHIFLVFGRII